MKRSELAFNLISVPLDIIALVVAAIVSFYIRTHAVDWVGPVLYDLKLSDFIIVVLEVLPIVLILFALLGLYSITGTKRFIHEFNKIIVGMSVAALLAVILFFFDQSLFPSRFIILSAWILSIVFVILGRLSLKAVQRWLFSRGYGLHKLVLVNGSGMAADVIQKELKNRSYGYDVIAEFDNSDSVSAQLEELLRTSWIDEIMQVNPKATDEQNLRLVEFARNRGIQFSFVPNLFDVQRNVIELEVLQGLPIISLKNSPLDGWGKVAKRVFDIIVSLLALILTSPLFLIVALAVKIDSRGPIFYKAKRGSRQTDFWCYKFRSMYTHLSVGEEYGGDNAEKLWHELRENNDRGGKDGAVSKFKDDPRVTKVGRFIRRTKLDELPQLWNVFRGDISMVGPRPHVLPELAQYKDRYPRVLSIKPGVFGVSQLAIITWPVLPFDEEMKMNMLYIENWSLWWDVKILVQSAYLLLFGKSAEEHY
jgi:exopolysaccharide biosynthesis polyprenyl glycosylphosphotransferase